MTLPPLLLSYIIKCFIPMCGVDLGAPPRLNDFSGRLAAEAVLSVEQHVLAGLNISSNALLDNSCNPSSVHPVFCFLWHEDTVHCPFTDAEPTSSTSAVCIVSKYARG